MWGARGNAWLIGFEVGDLAVNDVHVALSALGELRIVRHENDRRTHPVDLLQQVHDLAGHQ